MIKKIIFTLTVILLYQGCVPKLSEYSPGNLDSILYRFHHSEEAYVMIAAHRASNKLFPENSLAAIQYSAEKGVDIVEVDVRTTKDGKLILMHDETINRTTNGKGKVSDLTYEELSAYSLKSKWGDTMIHRVPLAEEALAYAKGKIMLDLDIKEVYVKDLVDVVQKTGTGDQVLFFDAGFEILDSVLLLDSALMVMPRAYSMEDVQAAIARYHPEVIHIDSDFMSEEVMEVIYESGARAWINALGLPDIKARLGFKRSAYADYKENSFFIIQTDLAEKLEDYLRSE